MATVDDARTRYEREMFCLEIAAADGTMTFARMADLVVSRGLAGPRYRATQAKRDFSRGLARFADKETVKKARQMQNLRVARLMRALWTKAIGGDTDAINSIIRLMDHQAKLMGLYAPARSALEISMHVQELAELSVAAVAFAMDQAVLPPEHQQLVLDGVQQYLQQAGGGQVIELAAIEAGADD